MKQWICLTEKPLCGDGFQEKVRTDASGAIVVFSGTTRDHHHGKQVVTLFYEAHSPMAVKQMDQLRQQALDKFAINRAAIAHRIGEVPVGDTSVVVAVSADHRGDAFDACRWLMDQVKENIPIFKRETFTDGHSQWTEEGFCKDLCQS